ncbi:MAG: glucose-6-phosphate dehydrogenase [Neisseria sp.]|nr:glucose-6-phosphate dehydrogenase [Neisseria sp.]
MKPQTNFDLAIFGATGDLAMRKLLPALYRAHAAGLLHPQGRILGVSRSKFSREEFLAKVGRDSKIHIKNIEEAAWAAFEQRIDYISLDVGEAADFSALAEKINQRPDTDAVVVYLSTAPKYFAPACEKLAAAGLNAPKVRIVLEKPLGTDLASCRKINQDVAAYFQENQIYRIDHYLGKEALQNILPLRFGNSLFEPLWNKDYIQSVQITIAETLGVEERGEFYDITGALRDMVQNHIIQMLCFTAMERPETLAADHVRDEKLKLIQALKPLNNIEKQVIRGQYAPSENLNGYTQEHKVPADSRTETYVAIKAEIDNPRWAGVPFYLRTGKRLAAPTAEIVLNFKPQPDSLYTVPPNRITISLQPQETVRVRLAVKAAGSDRALPAEMELDLAQATAGRRAQAYELLLREVIDGRLNLFNRRDELEAAWAWLTPVLEHWAASPVPPHPYPAGSQGPEAAREMLAANGDAWLEEQD